VTTRFAGIADDAGEAQVEGDLECQLGGNVDVRRGTARLWNGHALGFEAVEMKRNCALHLSLDFLSRAAGRDATRQVRRVCGEAGLGLLDDDQILHGFNPACLRMLFKRSRRHIVVWLARHGDEPRFGRVRTNSLKRANHSASRPKFTPSNVFGLSDGSDG
jgi:hypothetical protein